MPLDPSSPRVLLTLAVVAACRSKPTDDRPADETNPQPLLEERKRVERGEIVGAALLAPKWRLEGQRITCNGYDVASRVELDRGGKLQRSETVFRWAKDLREHWKQIHMGETFMGAPDVTVPADTSFVEAANLVMSMAQAGYVDGLTLHAGDVTARIDYAFPRPIPEDHDPPPLEVIELWQHGGEWSTTAVRGGERALAYQSFVESGTPARTPALASLEDAGMPVVKCSPPEALAPEKELPSCSGECTVTIGGPMLFRDALVVAKLVSAGRRPRTSVRFSVAPLCRPRS
jgi:hypothetical protein